ncbi:hypothetical protein DA718_26565 [Klebsiella huaxiensis]|uniref:Uncharacterized protein n=1 Tax=Klebsiella huaxiensis TaxID=2153354 RepID=A0A564N807_9ENTR|nr:hypothetical protein [Klebsiella huaxiensis]MDG1640899.1 hypothetical protein [Klebsiella huaxiensis]QBG10471.1 hypothetical protein DA718_26565 [Klebsiella huaxiensis]VUT02090.1 hypothetical protein SB6422_03532 [Klebsiella huaxiensis]VUT04934.1 hypothetical protein SB6421_04685 [Klebsiella huaxiensis]
MKELTNQEMDSVGGGFFVAMFVINTIRSLDIQSSISSLIKSSAEDSTPSSGSGDDGENESNVFREHMKDMFGSSAGRDLAKVAEQAGLRKVVNSIFGW